MTSDGKFEFDGLFSKDQPAPAPPPLVRSVEGGAVVFRDAVTGEMRIMMPEAAYLKFQQMAIDPVPPPEAERAEVSYLATLNAEVTEAIVAAQQIDRDALTAWKRVRDAELALIEVHPDGLERDIAQRGVALAEAWIAILETR